MPNLAQLFPTFLEVLCDSRSVCHKYNHKIYLGAQPTQARTLDGHYKATKHILMIHIHNIFLTFVFSSSTVQIST
nr:hypothetical protein CFP56_45770 [Quercus suber]